MFSKKISGWYFLLFFLILPLVFVAAGCGKKGEKAGVVKAKTIWAERWMVQRPMNFKRAGLVAVATGNRIYAIGGGEYGPAGLKIFDSVEYADVSEDGTIGEWKASAPLNMPRIYPVSVVYNGYVYLMGGESLDVIFTGAEDQARPRLLKSVERAKINPDNTLGEWILESEEMSMPRRGGVVFAHNGWLYAGGGFGGAFLKDVEKAKINPDGSLGKWTAENSLNKERYISGYAQKGDRFFVLGGHVNSPQRALNSVETAKANPDGSLSEWEETSPLYTRRFLNTSLVKGDTVYTFAGHNTINLSSTEKAVLNEDGTLSEWSPETPLNVPRRAAASVVVGDYVYVLGGMVKPMDASDSVNVVESAKVEPGKKLGNAMKEGSKEYEAYMKLKKAVPIDARTHLRHGKGFLKMKEYDTVLFDVEEALKQYPDYPQAYDLMADVYFDMGKLDEAESALKKSLDIESLNFYALIGLGYLNYEKGDFKAAVKFYSRAVKVDPESEIAHFNLGTAYLGAGDKEAAAKEFKWVLTKNPGSKKAEHLLDLSEDKRPEDKKPVESEEKVEKEKKEEGGSPLKKEKKD
ncbi:MAG: hypothetical protein BMS9Abin23_0080 [Thermodesulfobacteriota bacterium]|nr:MAG: hypothetical protein BMS9Abin23_0080 [Thermodesulfobacteriota bacterium]